MSLADAVKAGPPARRVPFGHRTKVEAWLAGLSDDDRAAALAVLSDPSWSHKEANDTFRDYGLDVSDQQFAKARRRHGFPG
ncbi:MAG: hypothetical protein IE935_09965 [Micrococcales bacterium]|nr:hypothetical protein [Micrococcales bacterium]